MHMHYQFVPYNILLIASAIITMALAIYGFRHHNTHTTRIFGFCMTIGTLWAVANALEIAALDLPHKLFWANIQYIAYALGPVAWLLTICQFTGNSHWINRRNIFLVLLIPLITIVLVWTDSSLGLVRKGFSLDTTGPFLVIDKQYGPWFWIHFAQSYLLNFLSVFLVIRTLADKNTVYRGQALFLLGGFGIVIISNLLYVTGLSPIKHFDITPIVFSISGALIAWGISRFYLLMLIPIARDKVLEAMESVVIVVDHSCRIVDVNPSFYRMFKQTKSIVGAPLKEISTELIPETVTELGDYLEVNHNLHGVERNFKVSLSVIEDYQALRGWVLVLNDITELKRAQAQLSLEQTEVAVAAERDRFTKDLHDNLGQTLGFSSLQIRAIQRNRESGNDHLVDPHLQRLAEIIDQAQEDLRRYVHGMRDNEYHQTSLKMLLEKQVRKLVESTGFERKNILIDIYDYEFPLESKIQLTSIVKEAFNNIMKHSQATIVQVKLFPQEKQWELVIIDNGVGFTPDQKNADSNRGSGLCIMKERACLLGGEIMIRSVPGETMIQVKFPNYGEA